MEATGFCWKCGKVIATPTGEPLPILFCCKKHEEQYYRNQDRQVKRGKRDGYGLSGSCH